MSSRSRAERLERPANQFGNRVKRAVQNVFENRGVFIRRQPRSMGPGGPGAPGERRKAI